jgi:hypothetical protein
VEDGEYWPLDGSADEDRSGLSSVYCTTVSAIWLAV